MRTLYALSKPIEDRPRLIGELTENNGKYAFEYKLGGIFPEWFLEIDEFPDPAKKYNDDEVRPLIRRLIPNPNSSLLEPALKKANLIKYDEWGLLEYYGQFNTREDVFFFNKVPERAVVYA